MRIEIGASMMKAEGFDRDHLPFLLWTRDMDAVPRLGDKVTNERDGYNVVMLVNEVDWLQEGEQWDVSISGDVIEVYGDRDLSIEEFADVLGVPRVVTGNEAPHAE